MPVFFLIDPEFCNDPTMNRIDTVTLSYTFFSKPFLIWAFPRFLLADWLMQKPDTTRTEI